MQRQAYLDTLVALIKKLDVTGAFINHLHNWSQVEYNFITFCLLNEIATIQEIRELIHQRLLAIGRENFVYVTKGNGSQSRDIDHAPSEVSLAYAIEHGELSEEEISRISFDHGDTKETYMLLERKKLLDTIMHQITRWMNGQKH